MKALITLCFASVATITALAQSQPTMLSQVRYQIEANGNGTRIDSLTHDHSNGRVSYGLPDVKLPYCPNDGVYTADVSTRVYKSQSGSHIFLVDKMTRAFNAAGQISEYREQLKPGALYKEVYKEWYHYNVDMQLDTQWATDYDQTRRLVYTYQNNIRRSKLQQLQTTVLPQAWAVEGVDSFLANGTDSVHVRYWDLGAGLQLYEKHYYQRDANMHVLVDSVLPNVVTYFSYDTAGRKVLDSALNGPKTTYRYDNNGNMVSKTMLGNSVLTRDTMTYNAVNQLTSVETYAFNNNSWVPYAGSIWRYYYYGFPTTINEVANNQPLHLYPIPATSYINIDMNFGKPEKFSVRILDMQGRIVRQWEEAAQTNYKKKILLDGMTAGNYIVHVTSESNSITRQFSVIQ